MSGAASPFANVSLAGSPLGIGLSSGLLSFSYRDVHHGEIDDIEFKVADPNGLWRSGFGPIEGTPASAQIGYTGQLGRIADCGAYEIDQTGMVVSSSGDVVHFRGLSAFTSQAVRTVRSEAYDDMTLSAVLQKIADRQGWRIIGPVPDLWFKRLSQSKQHDLAFVLRLAEDWGCYCSVKGDQMVFADRVSIDSQPPSHTFDISPGELLSCTLDRSSHALYPKAALRYLETGKKLTIEASAEDGRVISGDTLQLDDKVENQGQADRLVLSRLLKANDDWTRGSLTVVGRPYLVAGQTVLLGPTFGIYAGRYLVTMSQHELSASGYTTSIDLKGLG